MDGLKDNYRVKVEQEIFDLQNFKESDKDGDGRLSFTEFMDYVKRSDENNKKKFEHWIEKSDERHPPVAEERVLDVGLDSLRVLLHAQLLARRLRGLLCLI